MSLLTRTIIFVVAVVAFVAVILATAAQAQYAQDSWYEPPTKITVELHRITPHHRESKRFIPHHHHSRAGAKPSLASSTKVPASRTGATHGPNRGFNSLDGSHHASPVYYRLTGGRYFDPEYVEWLEMELARARRCRCPG